MRYAAVDFLNLPRIAALPGGWTIGDIAAAHQMTGEKPLHAYGIQSGLFINE
jgi:hypothetical protein